MYMYVHMSTFPPPPADLRRALVTQLKPYTRKATPTGAVLGSGTYGSVIELTSAGETVAGKVFRMSSTVWLQEIANRVCGELIMMTQLHHPNIVQYKGVSLLVDQPLPVLLMERLMSSLHAYLLYPDNSKLPMERKVAVLRDTASGLDYLHSHTPAIIHRDLTAKNVLLDSELRAKIADFGNSRIMDLDPDASPETLTSVPGTLEYMAPEAQGGRVTHDPSLDVFSFGHLSLFTITQTPLRPLFPPNYPDSSGKLLGRSEVKRRVQFVEAAEQLLSENRSLVALIKQCLHNMPAQRPRTGELLTKLEEMMTPGEWIPPSPSLSPIFHSLSLSSSLCLSTQLIFLVQVVKTVSPPLQQTHTHPVMGEAQWGQTQGPTTVTQRRGTVLLEETQVPNAVAYSLVSHHPTLRYLFVLASVY